VLSPLSARKAEKLGYTNTKVFHAGLPEWRKAGHIVVSNVAAIENFNKEDLSYILIDLRKKDLIEKGHIPNAVSIPDSGIDSLKDQFPKFMSAPIILYNEDGNLDASKAVFSKISEWGYKQVSVLSGGLHAWEKAGKQIAKGPAATKITYVRKLAPGEIELSKFQELLASPKPDTIILDVRNKNETEPGVFPNALNIPLDEIEQNLDKLPKDKKIVIHCATGARAEMAYNVLKKAGIDSTYLKAKVDFDEKEKGKYTIED
jgi:rhodanese-related sulfurtransferase